MQRARQPGLIALPYRLFSHAIRSGMLRAKPTGEPWELFQRERAAIASKGRAGHLSWPGTFGSHTVSSSLAARACWRRGTAGRLTSKVAFRDAKCSGIWYDGPKNGREHEESHGSAKRYRPPYNSLQRQWLHSEHIPERTATRSMRLKRYAWAARMLTGCAWWVPCWAITEGGYSQTVRTAAGDPPSRRQSR